MLSVSLNVTIARKCPLHRNNMSFDNIQDTALANALRERKKLQEQIRDALQKIERIDAFLRLYRDFSTLVDIDATKGVERAAASPSRPTAEVTAPVSHLRTEAWGQAQAIFENLAIGVLREVGRPMKSGEIVEEFRKRGHPIKGNAVRTAWNRLWSARNKGLLTNHSKLGYWIAGEPLTEEAKRLAAAAPRHKSSLPPHRNKGKPKGPPPALTPEQVEAGERMLLAGKTRIEVAAALGGVSQGTIKTYFGSIAALKKKYPDVVIPKRPYVWHPPRPGYKAPGRPRVLTAEQDRQIAELRSQGNSLNEIARALGIKRSSVYSSLSRSKGGT